MSAQIFNGCEYFFEEHGTGQETVVFAHDLFMSGRAWHNQLRALRGRYRCIEFDFRGHGRSAVPRSGYNLDGLADDLIQLIHAMGHAPSHLVGTGLGGEVALRVALAQPNLLRSLTVIGASAEAEAEEERRQLRRLALSIALLGRRWHTERVMQRLFADRFLQEQDLAILVNHWRREYMTHDRGGLARAIRGYASRKNIASQVGMIRVPTMVLAGALDRSVAPERMQALNQNISGSRFLRFPDAGHCPPVETPDQVDQALVGFFGALPPLRRG